MDYISCTYCGGFIGDDHLVCPYCKGGAGIRETYISKLIKEKWILSLSELSKRTGVGIHTIKGLLKGEEMGIITEGKLLEYIENYKGEV